MKMTGKAMDYEAAKQLSQSEKIEDRRKVAGHAESAPEILYYLIDDPDVTVRRRVAENRSTPYQGDIKLTGDRDEAVRTALATKIATMMPNLSAPEQAKLRDQTIELLRRLAHDQAVRVREILAEALQSLPDAPHDVINLLARDVELRVAEPVLRYSPVLTDADLMDIIRASPIAGALTAIASRNNLPDTVCALLSAAEDSEAIASLLGNSSAQIREDTLDRLLDRAPTQPGWHEPLVRRPRLPLGAIKRLATFVAAQLLEVLRQQPAVDEATAYEIAELVRTRISTPEGGELAQDRAQRLFKNGELDEPVITSALESGERSFVISALALKAKTDNSTVSRIISAHSAKGVTALAWKAGLSMRLALQLQTRLAGITPQQAIYPKEGTGYPLPEADLKWQLEFFGIAS